MCVQNLCWCGEKQLSFAVLNIKATFYAVPRDIGIFFRWAFSSDLAAQKVFLVIFRLLYESITKKKKHYCIAQTQNLHFDYLTSWSLMSLFSHEVTKGKRVLGTFPDSVVASIT